MANNTEENKKNIQKPRFSTSWKLLTVLLSLLILYTVYHVFFGLSENVQTTAAGLVEQSSSVVLEGIIFRDEAPVLNKGNGAFRPYLENGELASVGMNVGTVYSGQADTDINIKIDELKEKLDILKRSNVKGLVSVVDIEQLEKEIDELYTGLMLALSKSENYKASKIQKQLLISLNIMSVYKGDVQNYDEKIRETEAELDRLYNSFDGSREDIIAEKRGYFYHYCDGYEDILTLNELNLLTSEKLSDMITEIKSEPITDSAYECKFVYSHVWRLAALCDYNTLLLLEEGNSYDVTLFDVRERELTFTLEKIVPNEAGQSILIFSCSTMPEDFDYTRYQGFRIDISKIEGYRVPIDAVCRTVDKDSGEEICGVYVLDAGTALFKRINIISEGNGYYIVERLDVSNGALKEYLALNDMIITDPDGIYDGMILTR